MSWHINISVILGWRTIRIVVIRIVDIRIYWYLNYYNKIRRGIYLTPIVLPIKMESVIFLHIFLMTSKCAERY